MLQHFKTLYHYRQLLAMIAWRDIKVKYKQSLMGFMWAILMPLIVLSAGIVVRIVLSRFSGQPFSLSQLLTVATKAAPWAFCVNGIRFATNSLVGNGNLVTKLNFPKEIFPIAAVLSNLFDFLIAACLLTLIFAFSRVGLSNDILWVPVLIVALVLLVTGLGILLSALNLFFRDVKYLVETVLTFAIFFTPVLYDAQMFGRWANLLLLNPIAPVLEGLSSCVVIHQPPAAGPILYSTAISFGIFIFSYWAFKNVEPKFAENI